MTPIRTIPWLPDWFFALSGAATQLTHARARLNRFLERGSLTDADRAKAWRQFNRALRCAESLDSGRPESQEVVRTVMDFDRMFGDSPPEPTREIRRSLARLLTTERPSTSAIDAAVRLARRVGDRGDLIRAKQRAAVHLARQGDANSLITSLMQRLEEGTLDREQLAQVLNAFLERARFEAHLPWRSFFLSLPVAKLPRLHQVHAAMGQLKDASEIAEAGGDLRAALNYLSELEGTESAHDALALAERLNDAAAIRAAHLKSADAHWKLDHFDRALPHFQHAGQLQRASDCLRRLGRFAQAVELRPALAVDWLEQTCTEVEADAQTHVSAGASLEAVALLSRVQAAFRNRAADCEPARAAAERMARLVAAAMRVVRAAFDAELAQTEAGLQAPVFTSWSSVEEAAGNHYEAGLLAEKAHDFYAAARNFEKAGRPGQALGALNQTTQGPDPTKRAELLESGGDFFLAALTWQQIGQPDRAIAAFASIGEYFRAAEVRRGQVGDDQVVDDRNYLDLLVKANRVALLAELLLAKATSPGQPAHEKARLRWRIKELVDRKLLAPEWLATIPGELVAVGSIDRARFDQDAVRWSSTATRQVLDRYVDALGIDLGTTNSVVSLWDKKSGQPEVVESRGQSLIPSVFAIDADGREILGRSESDLIGQPIRASIARAKRLMGTATEITAGEQVFRPEEVSARVLGHLQQVAREWLVAKIVDSTLTLATAELGDAPPREWVAEHLEKHPPSIPLERAVLTVPAYFNEGQKQATHTAAKLAGITILRLMHEPTAACLALCGRETKDETVLVVDLGAGTFDLSLIEINEGVFEVKEIEGDNTLGSSDLDEDLYRHFVHVIKADTGHDPTANQLSARRLRQASEDLKIELSSQTSGSIELPHLVGGRSVRLAMTRADLENRARPFLERLRSACRKIKGRPSRVLLIGGGAQMPAVRRCVSELFSLESSRGQNPLTAVARGAAIQAAALSGVQQGTLVLDATPFSLGIKVLDSQAHKVTVLIPKHSTIPIDKAEDFTTAVDNQTRVNIEVFQGESSRPEDNTRVGEFVLDGIVPAAKGTPKITVTFRIDENCLLVVTARDGLTGRERHIAVKDYHLLGGREFAEAERRFDASRAHHDRLARVDAIRRSLATLLSDGEDLTRLQLRALFQDRMRHYESNMIRYRPSVP